MKAKAFIVFLLVQMTLLACAQQATVSLNNFDLNNPIRDQFGRLAPAELTHIQLLAGDNPYQLEPVLIAGTTTSIISLVIDGYFDAGVGVIPGVEPKDNVTMEARVWMYADYYENATVKTTMQWTQETGYWNDIDEPPSPPTGPVLTMPKITFIPEPSNLSLIIFGLVILFVLKRNSN
jgi:hypothetical protein